MNLNDLDKESEGIPVQRYCDYLCISAQQLGFYLGKKSENHVRAYLRGSRPTPEHVMAFLRAMAYVKSTSSEADFIRFKGFLTGRIIVPMKTEGLGNVRTSRHN